jgi:hypothetical protein
VAEFHVRGAADEKPPVVTVGSQMRPLIGMIRQRWLAPTPPETPNGLAAW